jgi:nicotinamide-nucleotide amidase
VKRRLLAVPPGPVVSAAAAEAMATGARAALGSDIGLGITGVAGPDEQDAEQPGTVYVGLVIRDAPPISLQLHLPGDRDRVRQYAAISALDLLRRSLLAQPS